MPQYGSVSSILKNDDYMVGAGMGTSDKMVRHAPLDHRPFFQRGNMGKNSSRKNGYGAWTKLTTTMSLSEAYLSLGKRGTAPIVSGVSVQVLNMILGKRQYGPVKDRKGQKVMTRIDDNEITLTYKEVMSYGYRLNKQGLRVKGAITPTKIYTCA